MKICGYRTNYYSEENYKECEFKCNNNIEDELVYCIFHDNDLNGKLKKTDIDQIKIEYNKELSNKIENCIKRNEELLCIGYILPELNIKEKTFPKAVYFTKAKIYGDTNIINNQFQSVFFNNTKFTNQVTVRDNKFLGIIALFTNLDFNGDQFLFSKNEFRGNELNFIEGNFKGIKWIDFSWNKFFSSLTQFSHSNFYTENNGILFTGSEFSGQVYFTMAQFHGHDLVVFGGVTFTGNIISFGGAKFFKKGVTFNRTQFLNNDATIGFLDLTLDCNITSFSDMKFFGETTFFRSQFKVNNRLDFDRTEFYKRCDFTETIFNCENISFTQTKFIEVDFKNSKFGLVSFKNTIFNNANFSNTKFLSEAYFSDCKFLKLINFNSVIFEYPSKIFILTKDLSRVSLTNTDITRIIFADDAYFGTKSKYKIYDEEILEENISKIPKEDSITLFENILTVYRNLRENYEYRMKYEEAGQFFIREMNLKRNYDVKGYD